MDPIKGRRIALVGGAGFIGHNLALELKRQGADVFILDGLQVNNFLSFKSSQNQVKERELYLKMLNERMDLLREADIPLHIQDARDYHLTGKFLHEIKAQVVVHLAAVAHANVSNKDPYSTFDHSLRTLENTLDYSRGEQGIEHFIYLSSSMVYGNFDGGFVTEESICNPLGIYGALKLCGEKMVIGYNQVFNLPYTIIRPSALYGERCVSRRVAQIFIENAVQGRDIAVSGDGSDALDFTYIGDLVQGITKVIQSEKSKGQTFNLTYGKSRTLKDIVSILKDYFPDVKTTYLPKDKLMPERGTLSVEKAKKLIGYDPQYPIEKGLVKYIEWYKSFLK